MTQYIDCSYTYLDMLWHCSLHFVNSASREDLYTHNSILSYYLILSETLAQMSQDLCLQSSTVFKMGLINVRLVSTLR